MATATDTTVLKTAIATYPHTKGLKDGTVTAPGLQFDHLEISPIIGPRTRLPSAMIPYERVATSIQVYHLDHYKIVDRRRQLYQIIRLKLDQAEDKLRRLRENADTTAQQSFVETFDEVRMFMSPEQPYSAAAKCALMALRGSYPVADMVLLGS